LHSDLLAICKRFGIYDYPIVDQDSWNDIRDKLLGEICDNSIIANNKTRKRLLKQYPGARWVVTSIAITRDPEKLSKFPKKRPFAFIIDVAEVADLAAEPRHVIRAPSTTACSVASTPAFSPMLSRAAHHAR
jgi:hypothetical protein